jgi:hypothetical protein
MLQARETFQMALYDLEMFSEVRCTPMEMPLMDDEP